MLTILGPTACGKTKLACHIAAQLEGEIISADSRQVYRHMDIGTGKDLKEFEIGEKTIAHHLINIKDPGYDRIIREDRRHEGGIQMKRASFLCMTVLCLWSHGAMAGSWPTAGISGKAA